MALLNRKIEKRTRITFYVNERDARRLEALKQQAKTSGLTICFRDDFNRWFNQQLAQVEKAMKAAIKGKGGENNG